MYANGLISIDYLEHSWNITPTALGREVTAQSERLESRETIADPQPLLDAVAHQAAAANPLAWPAVRPVLAALRRYWQEGGFSQYGIQLVAIWHVVPDEHSGLFAATIRSLVNGGYLEQSGMLRGAVEGGGGTELPGEVALTEKAHATLDGWPGAAPDELVQNLLAVIASEAEDESDPGRKRRLEKLGESIRAVGVSVTSEVIAKVVTGGLM